jgi:hypothetical protein
MQNLRAIARASRCLGESHNDDKDDIFPVKGHWSAGGGADAPELGLARVLHY